MKLFLRFALALGIFGYQLTFIAAQSAHSLLRKADEYYKSGDYTLAEETYRKAVQKANAAQGNFNLGNAIYQQSRYEEALQQFETAARQSKDDKGRSAAFHNLGNALYQQQQYDKSIDAYKNALRLDPEDLETKKNLALAQRKLIQQQQQQQQQQEEQNQEEQQEQEQQQQQQQNQQQQNQEQEPSPSNAEEQRDLSKEEARKLLEIMEEEEKKVQEKVKKGQAKPTRSKKEW